MPLVADLHARLLLRYPDLAARRRAEQAWLDAYLAHLNARTGEPSGDTLAALAHDPALLAWERRRAADLAEAEARLWRERRQ